MEFFNNLQPHDIEMLIRLSVSILLGFIIGIEREVTNKSAGLRTHILVCLGSTVFTILSIYAFPKMISPEKPVGYGDPARIAAQILTGIGFIGGGAILRMGPSVIGLTTAASLWIAAAIGMAVGTGDYLIGIITAISTVLVLTTIRAFEHLVLRHSKKKYAKIKVSIISNVEVSKNIVELATKEFNMLEISQKESEANDENEKITFIVDIYEINPTEFVYNKFKELTSIKSISIKELIN